MLIKQGNNATKTGKICYLSRENPVIEHKKVVTNTGKSL
jgi:hypothetical protein